MRGGKGISFGRVAKASGNRVVMNIAMADAVVCGVTDAVAGEASLPGGELGGEAVGEASLNESYGAFERFVPG